MKCLFFLIIIVLTFSCSEIETDVLTSDQLTIEGQILEGEFAKIYLTNGLPFKGVIDSLEVAKSIETKAKVELSNGDVSEILTLKRDDSNFPFFFYRSNIIKGGLDAQYNLKVTIRGKEFTSNTFVPQKPIVQDINFLETIEDGVIEPDFRDIKLTIDNKTSSNRYFKILIKNEEESMFEFAKPFIFNTENISTDTFPLIVSYNKLIDGEKENQLEIGNVIELQVIAITKEQFDFWKSIKGDITSPLDNSSFTNNVKSNISNGAFGYWSGENTAFLKFKIPEN